MTKRILSNSNKKQCNEPMLSAGGDFVIQYAETDPPNYASPFPILQLVVTHFLYPSIHPSNQQPPLLTSSSCLRASCCNLISSLHLMIPLHSLSISRRHGTPTTPLRPIIIPRPILILMNRRCHRSRRAIRTLLTSRSHIACGDSCSAAVGRSDDHVGDSAGLGVLRKSIVVVFGEFGDDVPGV